MNDVVAQLSQNPRCICTHFVVIFDNENHFVTFGPHVDVTVLFG